MKTRAKGERKTITILFVCFVMLCSIFIGFGLTGAGSVSAEASLSETGLQEEYALGSKLTIPSATLTYGGETKEAKSVVAFPDGVKYNLTDITLSQAGKYTVEYSAYFGNVRQTEKVSFTVYKDLYQVSNMLARAQYYDPYEYTEYDDSVSELTGVYVELPSGAQLQFNRVIDFSEKTKSDAFINFAILPSKIGGKDFDYLYFKLTDVHDPDNYVLVSYHDRDNKDVAYGVTMTAISHLGVPADYSYTFTSSYALAGAAFQTMVGIESHLNIVHKNDGYGTPSATSFHGTPTIDSKTALASSCLKDGFTTLSLDYGSKCIYTNGELITDLDNLQYYTEKWNGFSTGEAYLSVYAGTYAGAEPAKLFISDMDGADLSVNKFFDQTAPEITIDFEESDPEALPDGVAGYSYPVFRASAIDSIDGDVAVKRSVYYNYNSTNKSLCDIVDGKVKTDRSGIYTVVYEATDSSGNTAVETYEFKVLASSQEMSYSFAQANPSESRVGEIIRLSDLTVENYIGSYATEVSVTCAGKEYEVVNNEFMPDRAGEYTATYTVTDFIGRKLTVTAKIDVNGDVAPVFLSEAIFPKYLVSGKTYDLPDLTAYSYLSSDEGEETAATVYVTDKNGRKEVSETFVPEVTNSGDPVIIEYTASNAKGETVLRYEIPCYNVKNGSDLDLGKYFIADGEITVDTASSYTSISTQKDGSGFTFLNALIADGAEIRFLVVPGKNVFESFDLYLTDSVDKNVVLKISFEKGATSAMMRINDSADAYTLSASFGSENLGFLLRYDAFVNTFTANEDESVVVSVTNTLEGKQFTGFPSGKVYLSGYFKGVTGPAGIRISRINSQPITNTVADNIKPVISVLGEYGMQYKINDTVTLYDAVAGDVIDPQVSFTMSVRGPDKAYVKDVNGLVLENVPVDSYSIQLTQYGNYSVSYRAEDTSGRYVIYTETLIILDDVAPEITLSGTVPETASVNSQVTLPGALVTDNMDESLEVYVYIQDPKGFISKAAAADSEQFSFTPEQQGVYVVKYFAVDASGNITVVNYEIEVR